MKKFVILLCLGLMGCVTAVKEDKPVTLATEKPSAVNQMEVDSVISVFSDAIKKNPSYAGAYYNRAVAYFYKKDYERCWQDVHRAQSLGYNFSPDFLDSLKKASNREK